MTRPRVLYLSGWPIGAHGEGAASFVYEQIDALGRDVEALYVEHRFDRAISWARRRAGRRDVEPITDLWPQRVSALRLWTPRLSPRLTKRDLLEDVWIAGASIAARVAHVVGRVDLVHAHVVLPAGLLGAAISQSLGVPLLLQEHSAPFSMHLDTAEKKVAVEKVLMAASVVCAVGSELAKCIQAVSANRPVRVIPNLVRTTLFRPVPRQKDRSRIRLVSVGSLEKRKGFEVLIAAVDHLQQSGLAVEVRLVGTGSLHNDLAEQLRALGHNPSTSLLGALSRAETASVIGASHIYVCSSQHETFGLAPAEAISVGRPVVSTSCGGPEAYVSGGCGLLVPPGDARAMADAITNLWHRIDEFDPNILHGRIDSVFGPEVFRQRMLSLYDDVLHRAPETTGDVQVDAPLLPRLGVP